MNTFERTDKLRALWGKETGMADAFKGDDQRGKRVYDTLTLLQMPRETTIYAYQDVNIAPELIGEPWDNAALGIVLGFDPKSIRLAVSQTEKALEGDAGCCTVFLKQDKRTIEKITFHVKVLSGVFTHEQMAEIWKECVKTEY